MRTLTEMLAQTRRLLRDIGNTEWTDDTIPTQRMQDAARDLWDMFLGDKRAIHLLEVFGPAKPMVVYTDRYALPSDCLRLKNIEYRSLTNLYATLTCAATPATAHTDWTGIDYGSFRIFSDDRLYEITRLDFTGVADMDGVAAVIQAGLRAATGGTETVTYTLATTSFLFSAYNTIQVLTAAQDAALTGITDISGAAFLNGRDGAGVPRTSASVQRWLPMPYGFEGQQLVMHPSSGTAIIYNAASMGAIPYAWHEITEGYIRIYPAVYTVLGMYRFNYYNEPEFPDALNRTLFNVPEGTDVLLEYLTATYLAGEKIEDKGAMLQINYFGQSFMARWENWLRGRGSGTVKPSRRYVQRVTG